MPFRNVLPSEVDLLRSTLSSRAADDVAIVDNFVLVADTVMKRYVTQRSAQFGLVGDDADIPSASFSWLEAVDHDAVTMVKEYPYTSLFLNPLPPNLCEYPEAPPSFLLAHSQDAETVTKKTTTTVGGESGVHGTCRQKFRNMFFLNGGAKELVTILQGECGLAVVSSSCRPNGCCGAYLMSTDATSCAIVACRVGLHPKLRQKLLAVTRSEGVAPEDVELVRRCCETFTAAMGHFDRIQGLSQALNELLWESALPAWFCTLVLHGKDGMGTEHNIGRTVRVLVERLRCIMDAVEAVTSDTSALTLEVEWFLVGGIRSRGHTIPILRSILTEFFAAEEGGSNTSDSSSLRRHILSPFFRLSEVFGCDRDKSEREGTESTVLVEHRLREDGICFWSLNTVLRQWALGVPGEKYSCSACWGLLVDVAGGCCWPVAVQPNTRNYPLASLRHVLVSQPYRWICPLQCEGAITVGCGVKTRVAAACLGFQSVCPTFDIRQIDLFSFVALFLKRCEAKAAREDDSGHCSFHAPVLVRSGVWERDCVVDEETLNNLPDTVFLSLSTTPHCEPPDFVNIARQQLSIMRRIGPEEVFEVGTTGILV